MRHHPELFKGVDPKKSPYFELCILQSGNGCVSFQLIGGKFSQNMAEIVRFGKCKPDFTGYYSFNLFETHPLAMGIARILGKTIAGWEKAVKTRFGGVLQPILADFSP